MMEIIRIGEHSSHTSDFIIDRPTGHSVYLLLLVEADAQMLVEHEIKSICKATPGKYRKSYNMRKYNG